LYPRSILPSGVSETTRAIAAAEGLIGSTGGGGVAQLVARIVTAEDKNVARAAPNQWPAPSDVRIVLSGDGSDVRVNFVSSMEEGWIFVCIQVSGRLPSLGFKSDEL